MSVADTILRATQLEKTLGGTTVLNGIDLQIRPGQITVIIGPNGAGKTILLCCLAGGLKPDGGSVTIRDHRLNRNARHSLSFLPQDSIAVDHLTGRENARFFTRLHPCRTGRWRDTADTLDLGDDLDAEVRTYSGGMVRKLELAIALDPAVPLYLLDEPTAGVDLTKHTRFHDILLKRAAAGKTIVLSSHTPLDMELADTIVVVRDGSIGEIGRPTELLRTLPEILRVRGRVGPLTETLADHVIEGRWYVRGDEIRGFLRSELDPDEAVGDIADRDGVLDVTVEVPSFLDLFNYHTDPALNPVDAGRPAVEATWR